MIGRSRRNSKSTEMSGPWPQSHDCDGPLAPPPPISYLVNRNVSERAPLGRHVSSPSMQTSASAHQLRSATMPVTTQYTNAPLSAPSLFMPSPTSVATSGRFSPRTSILSEDRRLSAPVDEVEVYTEDSYDRRDGQRAVHSMYATRPPEINYPYGQEAWRAMATQSPATLSAKTMGGRQRLSTTSVDKELPAVPGEFPTTRSQPSLRPASVNNVPPRAVTTPWTMDELRQSSISLHARPSIQTMVSGPPQGAQTQDLVPPPILSHYGVGEFGVSTGSLGRWDDEVSRPTLTLVTDKSTRRRSRLANIASMFTGSSRHSVGREDKMKATTSQGSDFTTGEKQLYPLHMGHQTFPMTMHPSYSETALRKSTSSAVSLPRTSKASISRFADLIPQENELLALRYPTEEEREDLMRCRP